MYNIVCNTNTTTNANEIKALTRVESGKYIFFGPNTAVFLTHRLGIPVPVITTDSERGTPIPILSN